MGYLRDAVFYHPDGYTCSILRLEFLRIHIPIPDKTKIQAAIAGTQGLSHTHEFI